MLDLEVFSAPVDDGTDIVSVADVKKHIRLSPSNTALDEDIAASIQDAADRLHGWNGELNRTVFPMVWRRYLPCFPRGGIIRLPYPPLISVLGVEYMDVAGSSPVPEVDPSNYIIREVNMIPEIVLLPGRTWPQTIRHPRAVCVTYRAGYEEYPDVLKRMVKFSAAHLLANKESTVIEPRLVVTSRKIEFGMEYFTSALKVPVAFDQWDD